MKILDLYIYSFYQTVQCVSFCRTPGGERNIVDPKPWHPTWNLRLCVRPAEGTGIHPLNESPRDGAQTCESSAHPSLLICRRPCRPTVHTALWFLTVSFSLCLLFAWSTWDTSPEGENTSTALVFCCWNITLWLSLYTDLFATMRKIW